VLGGTPRGCTGIYCADALTLAPKYNLLQTLPVRSAQARPRRPYLPGLVFESVEVPARLLCSVFEARCVLEPRRCALRRCSGLVVPVSSLGSSSCKAMIPPTTSGQPAISLVRSTPPPPANEDMYPVQRAIVANINGHAFIVPRDEQAFPGGGYMMRAAHVATTRDGRSAPPRRHEVPQFRLSRERLLQLPQPTSRANGHAEGEDTRAPLTAAACYMGLSPRGAMRTSPAESWRSIPRRRSKRSCSTRRRSPCQRGGLHVPVRTYRSKKSHPAPPRWKAPEQAGSQ